MTTWTCACGVANDIAMRVCDLCGADRPRRPEAPRAEPSGTRLVREELSPEAWAEVKRRWRAIFETAAIKRPPEVRTAEERTADERECLEARRRDMLARFREGAS
jgi:hypothetical protein